MIPGGCAGRAGGCDANDGNPANLPSSRSFGMLIINPHYATREVMDAKEFIQKTVSEHPVVLFMKGTAQFPQCGFSGRAIQVLKGSGVKHMVTINVLEDDEVRQGVKHFVLWTEAVVGCQDHGAVLQG